jgi:hypothetical protein
VADDLLDRIESVLASSGKGLSTREVAAAVGCDRARAEQLIWGSPERFAWQPGGRWTLTAPKSAVESADADPEQDDTRGAVLDPPGAVELRAITLGGGSVLRVSRRPLDSPAVYTVSQAGRDLQLVLNSAHEVFAELPMPFDDEDAGGDYKRLLELLLAAWAVHEGEVPAGAPKRALEDARMMWGRTLLKTFLSDRD